MHREELKIERVGRMKKSDTTGFFFTKTEATPVLLVLKHGGHNPIKTNRHHGHTFFYYL